ncbi:MULTISPECIES: GGDEF and EAL domain-containing protein [unclassified Pseudomonas]|uniref:putative bifunctional diguanylate cyclase/phosphodiesterase n=1 Tax=unclassified Pseudomonas TaxID=196821 RepID=UPI000D3B02F5|nr:MULTISPECIES: GGDEF and EAL domain-containing protein [unclassified Pseudomonas]RAU45207.1 sensor domain-containing phosphodiesterase [Pseudomonas sp. RIT 409]RAU51343.1 sensor domain-containing phosphodiesterase [Pseudomonas sp. RIT 412]
MADSAPIPFNEASRLSRITHMGLLSSASDDVLDHIVDMVAHYFNAPIALVSIVSEHRQWFRAGTGLDEKETPREISFCAYSILSAEVLQVPDARHDPRFMDNPMVLGEPFIRFYAGVPLVTSDGLALGTLCVIDSQPRAPLDARDITMLEMYGQLVMKRLNNLRNASYVDQPTGLFNRLRLEEDILALANRGDYALVALDMVNPVFLDSLIKALGYSFAQELVRCMVDACREQLPADTALYKVSPTRIALLTQHTSPDHAEMLFRRLIKHFQRPLVCRNIPIQMELGIGVLPLGLECRDEKDWIRLVVGAADEARGKAQGWRWYEPHLDFAQQRAFLLLASLADAVRSPDQLSLVFQPRLEVSTGRIVTVEALLRWQHPVLGPISPAEFIPLAEKTALIRSLSLWVLRHAVEQARAWQRQGYAFKVAMNVSAIDLANSQFSDALFEQLAISGLDPGRFELEFTESVLCDNPALTREQLERLRALNIDIAIDDFGTGYSNWTYLRQLPATTVKLDKSLVENVDANEKDRRLVEAIVDLARRLGYRVVAEGAETEDVYEILCQLGCHEVQGFLIARPMTAGALEHWVNGEHNSKVRQLRALGR